MMQIQEMEQAVAVKLQQLQQLQHEHSMLSSKARVLKTQVDQGQLQADLVAAQLQDLKLVKNSKSPDSQLLQQGVPYAEQAVNVAASAAAAVEAVQSFPAGAAEAGPWLLAAAAAAAAAVDAPPLPQPAAAGTSWGLRSACQGDQQLGSTDGYMTDGQRQQWQQKQACTAEAVASQAVAPFPAAIAALQHGSSTAAAEALQQGSDGLSLGTAVAAMGAKFQLVLRELGPLLLQVYGGTAGVAASAGVAAGAPAGGSAAGVAAGCSATTAVGHEKQDPVAHALQRVDQIMDKLHDHILAFATTHEVSMFYLDTCNLETGQQEASVPQDTVVATTRALKARCVPVWGDWVTAWSGCS